MPGDCKGAVYRKKQIGHYTVFWAGKNNLQILFSEILKNCSLRIWYGENAKLRQN